MMYYYSRVFRAILPKRTKDYYALLVLVPLLTAPGYNLFFKKAPNITVHSETTYPPTVERGGTFYLNYDLQWDRTCEMTATRYIVASDNIEYEMLRDSKNIVKNQRLTYTTRIPIPFTIPPGKALIRSDFAYACDWWDRYISPIHVRGRDRVIEILPPKQKLSYLYGYGPYRF